MGQNLCRQEQDSDDTKKHSGLPISTPELLHENVNTTCIDIAEERSQDSASASPLVLCLKKTKNGGSDDRNEHISLPISTPELLHENVNTTCIDIAEKRSQDSASPLVLCAKKTKNGGSDDRKGHSSLPISTPKSLKSSTDTNSASASAHVARNEGPKRWVRHYCSSHKMLLVGEGDFSFSASLAVAFGSAKNMVATSLDSKRYLSRNYKKGMPSIHELRSRGCTVLHGVDATEMAIHCSLGHIKFDRIIFNFPHAGFCSDEPVESQTRRHQLLISLFFKNAKQMIHKNGEIHVTNKCGGFYLDWNLKGLASAVGLRFIEEVPFNSTDYPGYSTKYGFGCDNNFNSNPSKTYKFGLVRRRSSQQNAPERVNERE